MANYEIKLPALGEGIIEATITRWLTSIGSSVEEDEAIVEIATDKVDTEIHSPVTGILSEIIHQEGEVPKVGEIIAILETEGEENFSEEEPEEEMFLGNDDIKQPVEQEKIEVVNKSNIYTISSETSTSVNNNEPKFYSPFIRHLARQRSISIAELSRINGTGKNNRITKVDLQAYIQQGRPFKNIQPSAPVHKHISVENEVQTNDIVPNDAEIIEMDRMRKIIAKNMLHAIGTAPHVTSFAEADVTNLVLWREKVKDIFYKNENIKLTFTPIITEIVARNLKKFPRINSSVIGDKIIEKKQINIGIATALPDGNLVVPVVKNTDQENIRGLALKINDLAFRARNNNLQPNEVREGTFTITNIGQFNTITGTPIINLPEVAILAIGTIKKKPAVVTTENGSGIAIRDILVLSLTYDHRIIDGALGGKFLGQIASDLENFDFTRTL